MADTAVGIDDLELGTRLGRVWESPRGMCRFFAWTATRDTGPMKFAPLTGSNTTECSAPFLFTKPA